MLTLDIFGDKIINVGVIYLTKLILVRHGESEANFARIFTGQSDFFLTEKGMIQARAAAKYIKENENISAVFASPLRRAYDTGKAIAEECGVTITKCDGLMEINAGDWEGHPFDELEEKYKEEYHKWRYDIGNAHPDGGESVTELYSRCVKAVTEIAKQNDGKSIVLATHATPIRALTGYSLGIDAKDLSTVQWAANASLTVINYNAENGFSLAERDIVAHLDGILTGLPSNV